MFNSNSAWNWWNFARIKHDNAWMWQSTFLPTDHLFCKSTAIICQLTCCTIQKWTFVTFEQRFCYNHTWSCPVVAYRKQKTKECQISGPKSGRGRLRNLRSGRLRESFWNSVWLRNKTVICKVVAYGRWSRTRSGRYERVDCSSYSAASILGRISAEKTGTFSHHPPLGSMWFSSIWFWFQIENWKSKIHNR